MVALIVILVILILSAAWGALAYNALVAARNMVTHAFSRIDVQLQRRHDLIPNLVESVKGYMTHEQDTLNQVIAARTAAQQAQVQVKGDPTDGAAMVALAGAETALGGALGRLFALTESYPDLKANQNMLMLQEELSSTENKVSFARQALNDAVLNYNNRLQSFPVNLFAANFNFKQAQMWEMEDKSVREVPTISF
ncbi:LemA family protein [Thiorhodovibrio winogradskyi]|uniref:LemA family protein n=1 Tax=Thiorhodovibrio winogradskyi TaxID=77007 RepID=A0ABZ0SBY9_9GAMM|nr:LemA family protein [Thiorhodovibrio winogradskyi]